MAPGDSGNTGDGAGGVGRPLGESLPPDDLGETVDASTTPDGRPSAASPNADLGETIDVAAEDVEDVEDVGATVDVDAHREPLVDETVDVTADAIPATLTGGAELPLPESPLPETLDAPLASVLHFDVERELGRGGMGVVYLARDTRLGRRVALKALTAEITSDPIRVERLQREARIIARVNHPNIAAIHSLEIVGSQMYLILELVEGGELSDRIAAGMTLEDVWSLGGQIASAAAFAHSRSIVHRDLKPANLMVTNDDQVKVLDFGIACTVQTDLGDTFAGTELAAEVGGLAGTPIYMSPEQFGGGAIDHRADIWAFGCILYECLSGVVPFTSRTLRDLAREIATQEPDWSRLPEATPESVRSLIQSCLVKDRDGRLDDLQRAIDVLRSVETRRPTTVRSEPIAVTTAELQPLDRSVRLDESLLLRVVVSNPSPVAIEGRAELGVRDGDWSVDDRSRESFQIPAGESARLLLLARPERAGEIDAPTVELFLADHDDSLHVVSNRNKITVRDERVPPVVGQARAQEKIAQWLDAPQLPAGQLVVLNGESGSGVSDILTWASAEARERRVRDLRGYAASGAPTGQSLLHDLQRDLLCVVDAEHTDRSLRQSLEGRLAEYLGEDSPTAHSLVDTLLGEPAGSLTPDARMYRWFRLFAAASLESPIVLLLKDLHNADRETISVLQALLARCREEQFPVFAVATRIPPTAGDEASDPLADLLASDVCAGQFDAEPLDASQVEEILDHYYVDSHFRDDYPTLADAIVRKTSGQPAFVREVVAELAGGADESSLFVRDDEGRWSSRAVADYARVIDELPLRYADVLEARLLRVPEECRETLEFAALTGFEFPIEVLEALVPDEDTLDDALDALEVANLVRARDADLTWYAFTSSLVPDLVRGQIGAGGSRKAARKRGKVAQAVVDLYGDHVDRAEWLGVLLLDLGRPEDAMSYLLQGLDRRSSRGQFADAGLLIERIDRIGDELPWADREQEVAWTLVKARTLSSLGRPEEALGCVQHGMTIAERGGDAIRWAELRLVGAEIEIRRGSVDAAAAAIEEALAHREELPEAVIAQAQFHLAVVRRGQGDRREAVQLIRDSLALDIPDQPKRVALEREARGQNNLGVFLYELGEFEESSACFARTVQLAEQLENLDYQATASVWLANLHFVAGRLEVARSSYLDAIEIFRRLGKKLGLQNSYYNLGQVERLLGRRDAARQYLQRAVDLSLVTMDRHAEARNRVELGGALLDLGDLDGAAEQAEVTLTIAHELQDAAVDVMANALRTIVAGERGEAWRQDLPEGRSWGVGERAAELVVRCLRTRGSGEDLDEALANEVDATLEHLQGSDLFLWRFELLLAADRDVSALAQTPWGDECSAAVLAARAPRIREADQRRRYLEALG